MAVAKASSSEWMKPSTGVTVSMVRTNSSEALPKSKRLEKKNEWLFVNPYLIAGVLGASFCFTWFFAILTTSDFVTGEGHSPSAVGMLHFVFVAALLLTYFVEWLLSNWLQTHRIVLAVTALVCGVTHSLGAFSGFQPVWGYAVAALAGVGVAALTTLWIEFVCVLMKAQIRAAVAAMLALSFLWYVGTVFLDNRLVPYIIALYALLSGLTYLFLHMRFSLMDDLPAIPAKESDQRLQITWKPSLLTVMGSAAQGFALYWLLAPEVHTFGVSAIIQGGSLIVFALLLVDSRKAFFLKESFIRKMFLPVLAACILPLFFLPQELWVWPCVFAFLFSLLPYASAIFATCEHIARCDLSSIRTFGWGRLFSSSGLLLGLAAGWVAFSTQAFGSVTLPVMVTIVVMFFILVSTTMSKQSYYPGEEQKREPRVALGPHGEVVVDSGYGNADSGVRFFHLRCDAVAEKYGLSKRQTEVLHLLAKGRNAEYIQKQLVISPHTAKAHIYNIYQKTGSHSRQDLMDLVENESIDESSLGESL